MHWAARFWSKVKKADGDGCWEWAGSLDTKGYGNFNVDGSSRRASKVAYEMAHGVSTLGVHVLHRCDNRKCVRPDHLFLGTNADNVADKVAKGRQSMKLKPESVVALRGRYAAGGVTQRQLADEFGIGQAQVSRIINHVRRSCVKESR